PAQTPETLDGGPGHVDVVGRAQRLAEHVVDAGLLEDDAGRTAGDHAGTGRRRLQHDATGAEHALGGVDDRVAGEGDLEEVLAGLLGALLDGEGHLLGLAVAEADPAVAVADDDERGEAEATTALHDLGDAVDVDDARLAQRGITGLARVGLGLVPASAAWVVVSVCHVLSILPGTRVLELEPGVAGSVGEGLDPAVVAVAAPVEDDLGHTGGLGPLGG